jgi:glycosyltransferase involved in cell wall biosynthesis
MNRAERRRAEREGKTTDPLAITWYSNAVWAGTGYGTQTKQVVTRLVADGHRPAIATNYGLQATQMIYEGIPHYPMGVETWSQDVIDANYTDWARRNPDVKPLLIALFDAWPLKAPAWDRMPMGIWTMIDHLPAPPAVLAFLRKPNVTPLAASRFAHEQIEKAGIESIYLPMAIDTDVYKPTALWNNGEGQTSGREMMGFGDEADDLFVVSSINANKASGGMHRKAWGEHALAMSIFLANHKDARWYLHTEQNGMFGGVRFAPLFDSLEIDRSQVRFVNQWAQHIGIPNEAMAALFTATDVLLAPTMGEGFGLTVAEAGACETPTIVSDFTCQPELITDDSFLVGGQPWWDSAQSAWWQTPSVEQIVDALEAAYARGRVRSPKSRQHILDNFDADTVYRDYWRPALARLTADPDPVVDPVLATHAWQRNEPNPDVRLTIYIPTFKRDTLGDLLASLEPQLTPDVEVIISDNDPEGSALAATRKWLAHVPSFVDYGARGTNMGGDRNIKRGFHRGKGDWLWIIGDDDTVLPGAVKNVLQAIDGDDLDRLILLSREAPSDSAGMLGTMAELAVVDPGLPIAATLISANVLRRSALDVALADEYLDTMYGHAWANTTCHRVKVLASPAITVGNAHTDAFANQAEFTGDIWAIWSDLLRNGYGIEPTPESFSWNFQSVQNK